MAFHGIHGYIPMNGQHLEKIKILKRSHIFFLSCNSRQLIIIFINHRCADKILNQLEIHAKAELYFGGSEQNGERRSILQRTSVRMVENVVTAFRTNNKICLLDVLRAVSTPTPTAAGAFWARWYCGAGRTGAGGGSRGGTRARGRAAATTRPSRPSSRRSAIMAANLNVSKTVRSLRGGGRGIRQRGNLLRSPTAKRCWKWASKCAEGAKFGKIVILNHLTSALELTVLQIFLQEVVRVSHPRPFARVSHNHLEKNIQLKSPRRSCDPHMLLKLQSNMMQSNLHARIYFYHCCPGEWTPLADVQGLNRTRLFCRVDWKSYQNDTNAFRINP